VAVVTGGAQGIGDLQVGLRSLGRILAGQLRGDVEQTQSPLPDLDVLEQESEVDTASG